MNAQAQAALNLALSKSFKIFCRRVFRTLNPGTPMKMNWHLDAMMHALQHAAAGVDPNLIINVPPRSLKSTIASVALPAFIMGQDPSARVVCVSYAQKLASKFARDFRTIVTSPWYQAAFPTMQLTKNTEELFETTLGGSRLSTSVEGVVTGFGGRIIIVDDPIDPSEANSALARQKAIDYFDGTLSTRLDDKENGSLILVMQRLHECDPTGHLLAKKTFKLLSFPSIAIIDEDIPLRNGKFHHRKVGDVLHPARESQKTLDLLRASMGNPNFEAQYQQSPIPASGNMLKSAWIQTYPAGADRSQMKITQSWDTAIKGNPKADFSACTTWGELNGRHYVLDVFREQLDFPELLKAAVAMYHQYRPSAVLIEDHGSGSSLIQQLKASYGIYPIDRRSKYDKVTRFSNVLPMFEAGQVLFPDVAPWDAELRRELLGFPNAKHDDQVDSVSQYLEWILEKRGSGFSAFWPGGAPVAVDDEAPAPLWVPVHGGW